MLSTSVIFPFKTTGSKIFLNGFKIAFTLKHTIKKSNAIESIK